ncbi:hypothetical protein FRC04_003220 [Tulasnella sp. 424]|nr:hypothetical protein FRC04_003220 [Tulasnella sp. 424]KAG8966162.1 hypothetical protein FRC05_002786 [Tulasnella sp. 425]
MAVIPVKSVEEFSAIVNSGKPVFVDFWATWYVKPMLPSHDTLYSLQFGLIPVFERISSQLSESGAEFYKVDVDALPDVAGEWGIRAMPTFLAFKNGQKTGELVGANPGGLQSLVAEQLAA